MSSNNKRKVESVDYNNNNKNDNDNDGIVVVGGNDNYNLPLQQQQQQQQQQHEQEPLPMMDTQRKRINNRGNNNNNSNHNHNVSTSFVEDMIAIPVEYIFREIPITMKNTTTTATTTTPKSTFQSPNSILTTNTTTANNINNNSNSNNNKPLLSRCEAQCMIQINMLAYEMDALTNVSIQTLQNRITCKEYSNSLSVQQQQQQASMKMTTTTTNDHPYLRSIISILHLHYEIIPNTTIQHITDIIQNYIVPQLYNILQQLQQYSEQNETLADTLDATTISITGSTTNTTNTNTFANEKRKLSYLQDELYHRIQSLLVQHTNINNVENDVDDDNNNDTFQLSMKEYCDQLFQQEEQHIQHDPNVCCDNMIVEVDEEDNRYCQDTLPHLSNEVKNQNRIVPIISSPITSPDVSPPTTNVCNKQLQIQQQQRSEIADNSSITKQQHHQPSSTLKCTPTSISQRQLEQSFQTSTTTTVAKGMTDTTSTTTTATNTNTTNSVPSKTMIMEENEKENEPSQTLSIHSVQSTQHTTMSSSSQKPFQPTQQVTASTAVAVPIGVECDNTTTTAVMKSDHLDTIFIHVQQQQQQQQQQHLSAMNIDDNNNNASNSNQIRDTKTMSGDLNNSIHTTDDDDLENDNDDCFRTQGAAEVLSNLAKISSTKDYTTYGF